MDLAIDRNKVPNLEWKWNETEIGYEGVRTQNGVLLWFTFRYAHYGNILAMEQSFEDYLHYGPLKDSITSEAMLEIYDTLMNAVQSDNMF